MLISITTLLLFMFQEPGTVTAIGNVVAPILEAGAAATLTGYLVGFFRKAYPDARGSRVIATAIAAGLLCSALASMINGGIPLSQQGIALVIAQGISAAALSAGVQASNKPSVDEPGSV